MEYKKQHYIPQSYLNSWCDINKPPGYDEYVWVFECDGNNPKKKSPKNIFYETDLYTIFVSQGNRVLDIEHGLSEIEERFANIRARKFENKLELTSEERFIVLTFIAAMHNRTPSVKEHISKSWGEVLEIGKHMRECYDKASPDERKAMQGVGPIRNDGNTLSMDEVERICLDPLQTMMIPRLKVEADLYFSMHMSVLSTDDKVGFITSDQPCVWYDPDAYKRPKLYQSVGLGYKNVEVTFPISPRQAIIISHKKLPLYIDINLATVDSINRKTRFMSNNSYIVNQCYKNEYWFKVIQPPSQ